MPLTGPWEPATRPPSVPRREARREETAPLALESAALVRTLHLKCVDCGMILREGWFEKVPGESLLGRL